MQGKTGRQLESSIQVLKQQTEGAREPCRRWENNKDKFFVSFAMSVIVMPLKYWYNWKDLVKNYEVMFEVFKYKFSRE
jgi:hypothetical protein